MSLHLQMKKIPFCIQSYLSTGQYGGLSLLSCSVSSHYPTPCFRAKGGTLFMLTQGALRDKDEWEWDPACENWFFFFIEEELMLISDCIFASLIVIEFFFFLSEFKYQREEKERREKKGVLLIMRGDCWWLDCLRPAAWRSREREGGERGRLTDAGLGILPSIERETRLCPGPFRQAPDPCPDTLVRVCAFSQIYALGTLESTGPWQWVPQENAILQFLTRQKWLLAL